MFVGQAVGPFSLSVAHGALFLVTVWQALRGTVSDHTRANHNCASGPVRQIFEASLAYYPRRKINQSICFATTIFLFTFDTPWPTITSLKQQRKKCRKSCGPLDAKTKGSCLIILYTEYFVLYKTRSLCYCSCNTEKRDAVKFTRNLLQG